MNRVVIVTKCCEDQEFTRGQVAQLLGIYPDRVIRYWIEESQEAGAKVRYLLAEVASACR
jgi:hypothetical protein